MSMFFVLVYRPFNNTCAYHSTLDSRTTTPSPSAGRVSFPSDPGNVLIYDYLRTELRSCKDTAKRLGALRLNTAQPTP